MPPDHVMGGRTVSVAIVTTRVSAELIVGYLRNHDVRAVVAADDAGGQEPELQLQGVRVLVDASDETTARRLLADVESRTEPRSDP